MLRRTALLALVPLLSLTLVAAAATQSGTASGGTQSGTTQTIKPSITKGHLVKIQGQVLIKATQTAVWNKLVTTEGLAKLTGIKNMEAGKAFTKSGDGYTGTAWTDAGNVVCTVFLKEKELRTNFEPASAGYLLQHRVMLQRDPSNGTMLTVLDRYTDDNTQTVDATAQVVANELAAQLEAFREFVEFP